MLPPQVCFLTLQIRQLICYLAVRSVDSNHLILGAKWPGLPDDSIIQADGEYSDVISVNWYRDPTDSDFISALEHAFSIAKKPIVIGEFAFRGII